MEEDYTLHKFRIWHMDIIWWGALPQYIADHLYFATFQVKLWSRSNAYNFSIDGCIETTASLIKTKIPKFEQKEKCYPYLSTPPLGQNMTQGQFLSGV